MAFGLRQQGTSSFFVGGFSPGGAKNRQQKIVSTALPKAKKRPLRKSYQRAVIPVVDQLHPAYKCTT
jgi:hypothetical protein